MKKSRRRLPTTSAISGSTPRVWKTHPPSLHAEGLCNKYEELCSSTVISAANAVAERSWIRSALLRHIRSLAASLALAATSHLFPTDTDVRVIAELTYFNTWLALHGWRE